MGGFENRLTAIMQGLSSVAEYKYDCRGCAMLSTMVRRLPATADKYYVAGGPGNIVTALSIRGNVFYLEARPESGYIWKPYKRKLGRKTMNYTAIRKLSLKIFLGFLGLTALIAIISVLSGEFGELQWKILATSFTISAASICSMSCAAFIEKKRLIELGISGIIFSVASAILLIAGMWLEIDSEGYWKTTITLVIAAVAFAHAFLLVLPELDDNQKWVQRVSSVSIGILALQIAVAVWGEINNEGYYRLLAVVAIIVGLETLAIPMLMKLRKGNGQKRQKLVLEKLEGDIYRDSAGKQYQLKDINSEQGCCT